MSSDLTFPGQIRARIAAGRAALDTLGQLFARSDNPYAGADLDNARRMGGLARRVSTVVALLLLPFAPPDRGPAALGWAGFALAALVPLVVAVRINRPGAASFNRLYAMAFVGIAQVGFVEWLAGGAHAPYGNLYLLMAVIVAGTHPPRRVLAFMAVLELAALSPLLYGHVEGPVATYLAGQVAVWAMLPVVLTIPMSYIRLQRQRAAAAARLDALTGLGNRRAFDADAERLRAAAERSGEPLGVLLIDLDRFKEVNDRYGHPEGDRCLRAVADAIRSVVRDADAAYRWGGDEFALLLPGAEDSQLGELSARLRTAVAGAYRDPGGEAMQLSCGSATLRGGHSGDVLELADRLLLAAKRARRSAAPTAPALRPAA